MHEIPHMPGPASDRVSMHDGRSVGSFQIEINELQCHDDVEITGNEQEIDPRILNDTAGTIFTDASGIDDEIEPQIDMRVGCTDHGDTTTDSEGGDTTHASGDNEDQQPGHRAGLSWDKRKPPTETVALEALRVIQDLLCPPRGGKRKGYKEPKVNGWSKRHLQEIETMLNLYTGERSKVKGSWMAASAQAAQAHGQKPGHARSLRSHAKKFVELRMVPVNPFGAWTKSRIETDEEFAQDINLHLQSLGKYVKAHDIVTYLNRPDVKLKWGLKTTISDATAKRWMHKLGYRWVKKHRGMYVDGHERDDVVQYRQSVFLPAWYKIETHMRSWTANNVEEPSRCPSGSRRIVPWFHDESVFYAHDRRESHWVKKGSSPEPYAKGEGASLMVADFVSADYGFLCSRDGKESARVTFKPGKNRDGYFTNEEIMEQAEKAMKILARDYPDEDHILIYDNATTHLKRADDAISARKMPKNIPKEGTNWGIEVNAKGPDGKNIYGPDGKLLKIKIRMGHGTLQDGSLQDFYFPDNHPRAGVFKGMAKILEERGHGDMSKVRAECPSFKCDLEVP